jgi:hypothetical protein
MRYSEIVEAQTLDPRDLGEITSGPDLYLHVTDSEASLRSILARGFDLRRFGATAKRTRQHDMAQHDPRGIYATAYEPGYEPRDKPWVVFAVEPAPAVLAIPDGPDHSDLQKSDLVAAYGAPGATLSKALLRGGVQVVHAGFEFIILDPKRIRIVKSSLG